MSQTQVKMKVTYPVPFMVCDAADCQEMAPATSVDAESLYRKTAFELGWLLLQNHYAQPHEWKSFCSNACAVDWLSNNPDWCAR